MWNGLSSPRDFVGGLGFWARRTGRSGASLLLSRRRGLGVKVERPERSEDERP